jgi:hypothetical protein
MVFLVFSELRWDVIVHFVDIVEKRFKKIVKIEMTFCSLKYIPYLGD